MAGQAILQIIHVLVFMLHGLYIKWKHLVAYCLIDGDAKGEMLVNFLMEFFDASHNAGLEVVATTCDMDANSFKALKHLGVFGTTTFVKKLRLYLILPISLNLPVTFS
jgi:hypothetical protein